MGRPRQRSQGQTALSEQEASGQQDTDAERAAEIAALFVAPEPPTAPALAAILLPFLPAWLLGTPALADEVAQVVARVAIVDPPKLAVGAGEFELRASLENLLYRGFYALAALKRLSGALSDPSDTPARERLSRALTAERSHFTAHQNARARNLEGARKTDAARELYGDLVSWNHGAHGTPMEPRPSHVAADGKLWDLRRGVPLSTGALPRTLSGCTCDWGPPRAGAERLI